MNLREKLFLRRLKTGDTQAAERLIKRNYAQTYGLLFHLTKDSHAAEDLTQETFLRVWRALSRFKNESSLSTWIYRIAYNVFLEHKRAVGAKATDAGLDSLSSLPDKAPLPDVSVMQAETDELLRDAVEGLPEKLREVVYLRYYQELSIRETAAVLGVATSTVKYRLRTGLDVLRRAVGEGEDERSLQREREKGPILDVERIAGEALRV